MSRIRSYLLAECALFMLTVQLLPGQGTSSLRGTVSDTSHGAVEQATVTLMQSATGVARTTTSQKDGAYQFAQMPPGDYSLTVEATGFAVYKVSTLHLQVSTPVTADIELQVATTTSTVDVNEQVARIDTTDATLGNGFQQPQVEMLPLQTRNVVELLSIQPGVTTTGEVMGARRDQNNITLDGVDSNDNQNALSGLNGTTQNQGFNSAIPVPLDSVMEFRVSVAGFDATAGRSSGGQVSLITKSGTNTIHGSAYEYNRNTDFTANDWFNNRDGLSRPQLVRNQFGATLGGPARKDRLFYFFNYERRIDSSATPEERQVPTENMKAGILKVGLAGGAVAILNPSQVQQIDPLGIGVNPAILSILQKYPAGNDPSYGEDNGLNFTGYRFNAPSKLDNRIYVGRVDYILDSAGRNVLSFRGTLSNEQQTLIPAWLPGESDAQALFADNRGFSARYTASVSPALTNVLTFGLSRIGYAESGAGGNAYTLGPIDPLVDTAARASSRINPTWNAADDVTWIKGRHTLSAGFNFRNIDNRLTSYANSWPHYSYSQGILFGLGADIQGDISSYLGGATLANSVAATDSFGAVLGLVDNLNVTYQYNAKGEPIAIGSPTAYDFITRNYEGYAQDVWKIKNNLTLTYGIRYQYDTPPYEATGLQVASTPGIDQYFATREYAQENGIPGNQLPDGDRVTFNLNGPVNGKSSWYKADTKEFAPRISIAYAPTSKTSIRAGAGIAYDQYGNDLAANVASLGSAGLGTSLGLPTSYNFTTSPRVSGGYPALPTAPAGGFPFTLPDVSAIAGTLYGIDPHLTAPYSYLFNFTVSHQFSTNYSLDVSYIGRFSHKLLAQVDTFSPLIYFKDNKSGATWVQADTGLRALYNQLLPQYGNNGQNVASAVQANPSMVPTVPFVEDMFPGLANHYFPGSASANYFYSIYGVYGGSDLDNLHSLDRADAPNNCFTITGCYTFFAPQGSSDPTWANAAHANYNGLAVSFRHQMSHGLAFDLNYTWSHSLDNASSPADNSGQYGGDVQNAFYPNQGYGSSDFDIRHQFNADVLYALPVGQGQKFFGSARGWVNRLIGGWQISSLIRAQTGLPTTIGGLFVFPTNYWQNALAVPNGPAAKTGVYTDENGNPNLFQSLNAINSYQDEWPGQSGSRAIVRVPGFRNVDISISKDFHLPWEGQVLQFRAEAYNAFNFVNFTYGALNTSSTSQYATGVNNLSLTNPNTFGEFTSTMDPRVLQLSLHYSF